MLLMRHQGSQGATFLWDEAKRQWVLEPRTLPGVVAAQNRTCYDSKLQAVTFFGFDRYIYRWTPARGWVKDPKARIPIKFSGSWQWDGAVAYDRLRDRFVRVRTRNLAPFWENWEWDRKTWRWIPGLPGVQKKGVDTPFLVSIPELGGLVFVGGVHSNIVNVWWGNHEVFLWNGKSWNELKWARFPDFDPVNHLKPRRIFFDYSRRELVAFSILMRGYAGLRLRLGGLVGQPNFTRPGGSFSLALQEPQNAGDVFALAFSLDSWPGLPFLDAKGRLRRVPLAADALFQQSLGWGMLGVLDSKGQAKISIPVPAQKDLAGLDFYGAAILVSAKGVLKVSNELHLHVLR